MNTPPNDRDPWLGGEPEPLAAPERKEPTTPESPETPEPDKRAHDERPERPRRDAPPHRFDRPSRSGPGNSERGHRRSNMRESDRVARDAVSTTWRLFVAIELPGAAIEEIGSFINDMPSGPAANVRWTPRQNVHITLQFLGDTEPALIGRVQQTLAEMAANSSPMLLQLGEAGAFPDFRSARILWVGLTGDVRRLVQLQGRIEGAMRALEYEPERRKFTPHISIGRVARSLTPQEMGDVGFSWRRTTLPKARAQIPVREVVLFRSRLQMGGPVYEKLFAAKLGG